MPVHRRVAPVGGRVSLSAGLAGLSAGRYEVVAWHERVGEVTLAAAITAGQTANLSSSLPLQDPR